MNDTQLGRDMGFLAGNLPHRGSNTTNERAAAEYIRGRFASHTPDTELDEFHSIDAAYVLFSSYYAEFFIVALVAHWFPRVGLCYGAAVFLAYLAESMGYNLFARLLPQFETQNVAARFLATHPKRLLVVTAHYDTPKASFLTRPGLVPWARAGHLLIAACMLLVMISCAAGALHLFSAWTFPIDEAVRWCAVGVLLCASGLTLYAGASGQDIRGASGNASGVAVLLRLAERLATTPLEEADVWLVATGSKESWLQGMHHLLATNELDRRHTYFLNIDHVGGGRLCYIEAEGMLRPFKADAEMLAAAQEVAEEHGAVPQQFRCGVTDAFLPLARGFKALGVMGLDERGLPPNFRWHTDKLDMIDHDEVARAAGFAEAVLRQIAAGGAPERHTQ